MLTANKPKSRQIDSVKRQNDALILKSEHGMCSLKPVKENIIRVTYTVQDEFSKKDRPGVTAKDNYSDWTYAEEGSRIKLELKSLSVVVRKDTGSIGFYDKKGALLFKERDGDPIEFEQFETYTLADGEQKTKVIDTADGKKEVIEDPSKISTGKSYHIRHNFVLGDEALYGMGQQEKGFASLRGHTLYIHQGNRKIAVPMFVSTKGYGLLTDTYSPLIFNDDLNGTYIYTEADQESDFYFIAGDMNGVIAGYRYLTGKAAMLPKWAFGYVQSQERFESQEEIINVADRSRELGIGMDCIVLDWFSWIDGHWGQKSYDESRFPAPEKMIEELHDKHVHFMISIWPAMGENTADYKEFKDRDLLLPASNVYNALNEKARTLYFDQLKRTHFSYGTDAWWCDSSEPFTPEWNRVIRMEQGDLYRDFCNEAGLRIPYEYCNCYPLYHAMGIYENQRKAMDENKDKMKEKRVCNLTRSAYTGQQRYGTIMWSGDTDASWDTFKDQIAIGLHFVASGIPYWTMDTGAFFVKKSDVWYWNGRYDDTTDNKGYCELYTRWYQYAAFLPVFRAHGTDCRRELWNFKGEFYDAMLKANRLRYKLMPYIYSEAGKVWLEDKSLIRWLAFDFADDRIVWGITDQYMFGESLMVCPVTEPMYYDEKGEAIHDVSKSRKVYFPIGCDWYDFYTGEKYKGGSMADIPAELDKIPLFAKEGSIIPVTEPAMSVEEQKDEISYMRFGTGPDSYYEFYEDDGDGYEYENGKYSISRIS